MNMILSMLEYDIINDTIETTKREDVSFHIESNVSGIGPHYKDNSLIKNSRDQEEFDRNTSQFLREDHHNTNEFFDKDSNSEFTKSAQNINKIKGYDSTNSPTCYICIKVNNNKNFINCPMDRKMKNKLVSEFWFQIYDDW